MFPRKTQIKQGYAHSLRVYSHDDGEAARDLRFVQFGATHFEADDSSSVAGYHIDGGDVPASRTTGAGQFPQLENPGRSPADSFYISAERSVGIEWGTIVVVRSHLEPSGIEKRVSAFVFDQTKMPNDVEGDMVIYVTRDRKNAPTLNYYAIYMLDEDDNFVLQHWDSPGQSRVARMTSKIVGILSGRKHTTAQTVGGQEIAKFPSRISMTNGIFPPDIFSGIIGLTDDWTKPKIK